MSKRGDDELATAWHELMSRYHRVSCALDRELQAAHGLSASEFEVLQQLHALDGTQPVRMQELGEQVHVTQSALSRMIARLERDGLVERCVCVDDRRSVLCQLTPAGQARFLAARPTQRAVLREAAVAGQ